MKVEIRIAGFGGQGIIRSGLMLAMASCVFEDKNAVQTQSYGPESRGGRCRSEVIISDEEIDYPLVQRPDIVIIMSQEAYNEYADTVKEGGILLVDPDAMRQSILPNIPKGTEKLNLMAFERGLEYGKAIAKM